MSKLYLITLKPLNWFCFGGERTLGDGQKADYIARSNPMPQQSSLTGMLRYQLLKKKNWLTGFATENKEAKEHSADIDKLIGRRSFTMENLFDKSLNMGCIEALSPLMLKGESDRYYFPMPFDQGYKVSFETANQVFFNGDAPCILPEVCTTDGNAFNHKTYNNPCLWCAKTKNGIESIEDREIWTSKMQIGITKNGIDPNTQLSDNTDGFYKQEYLSLKPDWAFAFYLQLSDNNDNDKDALQSDRVQLGAQGSVFKMEIERVDKKDGTQDAPQTLEACYKNHLPFAADNDRIVILSPTWVESLQALTRLCNFVWSDSIVFRHIVTDNSNSFSGTPKKSRKYHFLKPGSVLYPKKDNYAEVVKLLNQSPYLHQAGYNFYLDNQTTYQQKNNKQ